jgi:predicted nucleic acid-binding protein
MKSPIFIDTGYILTSLNTADAHHERALVASRQVRPPFLTTEAVLTEIGNALSRGALARLGLRHDSRFTR